MDKLTITKINFQRFKKKSFLLLAKFIKSSNDNETLLDNLFQIRNEKLKQSILKVDLSNYYDDKTIAEVSITKYIVKFTDNIIVTNHYNNIECL